MTADGSHPAQAPEPPKALDAQARLAVKAAGLGLWEWDVAAGLFTIDARFAEILGRPALAGAPFDSALVMEMTHPDDRDLVRSELGKTLEHEEHSFSSVHRAVTPEGDVIWLRARAAVTAHAGDGAPTRVAGVVEDCTQEQRDALERQAAQRRADLVLEASAAGVWDWDIASGAVYWSEKLRSMLGVSDDAEIAFDTLKTHIHPDDCAVFEAELAAHLETGDPYAYALRMLRTDGEVLVTRVRGQALRDETGAPVRMAGSVVDITSEVEAREAARTANLRAALALEATGHALAEHDLATGMVDVSAALAALLGQPDLAERSVEAETVWRTIHPDDYGRTLDTFQKLESGEIERATAELRIQRPDGELRWLQIRSVRPRSPRGGPGGKLIAIASDLTERMTAELALKQEKKRYDLAVAGAHMAVWEWFPGRRNVTWSPRFNEILGLPADYPGETIEAFNERVHPDDAAAMSEAAQRTGRTGAPYEMEFRVRHAGTGDWVVVRSRASAELGEDGTPTCIAGTLTDVTALHAAREQAALDQRRVQLALEAGGLAPFDFDFETELMHASEGVAEILGEPEFIDQPIPLQHLMEVIHPGDRELTAARLEAARIGGSDFISEHRITRPDGETRWTLTLAAPTAWFDDGAVKSFTGVIQDLTDRKQTELALAEANDRFTRAVESSLIAIWDWDLVTDRVHWSPRLFAMLGLEDTDRIQTIKDVGALVHPDDMDRLREVQRRHFEHDDPFELEYRMFHNDGGVVRVRARGAAQRDGSGAPVRFVGSIMDVTAERQAEEAARLSGTRAQYALEAAALGVWEYDAGDQRVIMDARLADLLGRPDLADTPLDEDTVFAFTAPEDVETVHADMRALSSGETDVIRSEHRVVRADGRRIWILAHVGAPERDAHGRPRRLIGITQDLTGQKAVEHALRASRDRAEAANEAKSAFLATMSHEIRTPLNGVLGMAQLLTLGELDERQRTYAQTILSSGRALSAIIEDVLDISRIEAGRMALAPAPVEIGDLIETAVGPARGQAESKGLELSVAIEDGLDTPRIMDATRMAQVLGNLVSNAVKFTQAGGVRVRVRLVDAAKIRFEVEDDGPGVAEALQATIFERFTQADMTTRRSHGGSGLGLAIARELTELADGQIGVESTPGQGALFWFEIPAARADEQDGSPGGASRSEFAMPQGLKVLVLDDHNVSRTAMLELLGHAGVKAVGADCAQAALERLRTERFDAVLLDLHMPGDGGDAVLGAIREGRAGRRDLPAFFISADVTTDARARAATLGANGYFAKPLELDQICAALARLTPGKDLRP